MNSQEHGHNLTPSKSQAKKESGGDIKGLVGFLKTQNNFTAVHHRFKSKLLMLKPKIFTHFIRYKDLPVYICK